MKRIACLLVLSFIAIGRASAEEAPKKPWKNVTEASYVSTNGNTKSTTYAVKDTFNYDWRKFALELIGAALGSDNQGATTTEKYLTSEKLAYKITDRNYAFEKFEWVKDRFAGVDNRYDSTAGLGRQIMKSPKNLLIGELGGGYVTEERTVDPTNEFASGRAYSKYEHIFTPTATFSQDAEYIHNFENSDDFRVKTETSLVSALSTHLSLKVGYRWNHVGVPPLGIGRNDTITSMALIATY